MQVRCVKPFGNAAVGDLAEVPDDATVDPEHWEVVPAPAATATPVRSAPVAGRSAATAATGAPATVKEGA